MISPVLADVGVDRNVHPGEAAPHGSVLVLGLLGVQGRRPQVWYHHCYKLLPVFFIAAFLRVGDAVCSADVISFRLFRSSKVSNALLTLLGLDLLDTSIGKIDDKRGRLQLQWLLGGVIDYTTMVWLVSELQRKESCGPGATWSYPCHCWPRTLVILVNDS